MAFFIYRAYHPFHSGLVLSLSEFAKPPLLFNQSFNPLITLVHLDTLTTSASQEETSLYRLLYCTPRCIADILPA